MEENKGQILLYQTVDGESRIEVTLCNNTVWLTLDQMAELFQRNKSTISRHIKNVFESGELQENSVVAFFATTASDGKIYQVAYYNLDMIISIGYRVKSYRGVQFRIWATQILKEYLVKGFVMNDELLKRAGGGNYFDELLSRIRDIRSSEKIFYRKILEIYALSIDYDPSTESTRLFFATVQNKMHFSVHGHTAAEVIYGRADAGKDFMGLTNWTGAVPKRNDIEYAKNYLTDDELKKIIAWEKSLPKDEKYCGVAGNLGMSSNFTPNTLFETDYYDGTLLDRYRNIDGERALAFFTEIHKKYRYPEYSGEKFMTEAVIYNRMANDGYKMRFYNDIVWIYEYRSDGLTKAGNSLFLNNPRGYGLWLKEKALFMNFSLIKRIKMYYTFSCDLIGKYSTKVIAECIGAPVVMIRALISIHTLGALIRRKR